MSNIIKKAKNKIGGPPPGHPDANKNAKLKTKQQDVPDFGTQDNTSMMQGMKMNVPQKSITMKNPQGGMARSMGGT